MVCNSFYNESIVIKSKEKFHTEFTVKGRAVGGVERRIVFVELMVRLHFKSIDLVVR